jgi:hypothetical protein
VRDDGHIAVGLVFPQDSGRGRDDTALGADSPLPTVHALIRLAEELGDDRRELFCRQIVLLRQ